MDIKTKRIKTEGRRGRNPGEQVLVLLLLQRPGNKHVAGENEN